MKTINVTKPMEVEECKRCDGYIDGDMQDVDMTIVTPERNENINLFAGRLCGKCLAIVKNSLTKRTRKPKPTTTKGGV